MGACPWNIKANIIIRRCCSRMFNCSTETARSTICCCRHDQRVRGHRRKICSKFRCNVKTTRCFSRRSGGDNITNRDDFGRHKRSHLIRNWPNHIYKTNIDFAFTVPTYIGTTIFEKFNTVTVGGGRNVQRNIIIDRRATIRPETINHRKV